MLLKNAILSFSESQCEGFRCFFAVSGSLIFLVSVTAIPVTDTRYRSRSFWFLLHFLWGFDSVPRIFWAFVFLFDSRPAFHDIACQWFIAFHIEYLSEYIFNFNSLYVGRAFR